LVSKGKNKQRRKSMSERTRSLIAVMVSAALLPVAGIIASNFLGVDPAKADEGERTASGSAKPLGATQPQRAKGDVIPGRYIVVLKDSKGQITSQGNAQYPEQVSSQMAQENEVGEVTHTYDSALKGFAAKIPEGQVDDVRSDPRVAFVAEDRQVHAMAQTLPTGVNRVDADLSSAAAGNASGVVNADIAILDTGIYRHPDLNRVGGKDCSTDGKSTFSDDHGHGTHVAGIAAAKDDTAGVVGTAPGARLWAVKILKASGSSSVSDVLCGVDWVTQNASTIEVANMSLGGSVGPGADDNNCGNSNDDPLHRAICNSVAAGVTYVVAAGNGGVDASQKVPAAYDEVITVSALADYDGKPGGGAPSTCRQELDDDFPIFSNFGPDVDIGAPGVCITSTWKGPSSNAGGTYNTISGTSMASPHVTGAAALYKSTHPSASPSQVKAFMIAPANTEAKGNGHADTTNRHPERVLQMDNY
jgi:subtilisin